VAGLVACPPRKRTDVPTYLDLIYPTLKAVASLGGSALGREVTARVIEDIGAPEEQVAITYENRPKSVLIDRLEWARSYAKLGGALESPQRGLFVLTTYGKELLALPEDQGVHAVKEMDRQIRLSRARTRPGSDQDNVAVEDEIEDESTGWTEVLLSRLHRLTAEGFEEFAMYLLRAYSLELRRVGGTGDQGIDGNRHRSDQSSPVVSSRRPGETLRPGIHGEQGGRRSVPTRRRRRGAERAVLVTLGRFSEPARRAAIATTPTVDLIDGEKLCQRVRDKEIGIRIVP